MSEPSLLNSLKVSVVCPKCEARDKVTDYLMDCDDKPHFVSDWHFLCDECSTSFPAFIFEDYMPMKTCLETMHGIPQMMGEGRHCSLQRAYRHEGWWVIPVKYDHEI